MRFSYYLPIFFVIHFCVPDGALNWYRQMLAAAHLNDILFSVGLVDMNTVWKPRQRMIFATERKIAKLRYRCILITNEKAKI